MDKDKAALVVEQLVAWGVPATVAPIGMHSAGVRVRLGGSREALWDADGAAGLDAQVLRDGMLVGYVAELPDSAALAVGHQAWLIATADYDLTPRGRPGPVRPAVPPVRPAPPRPAPLPAAIARRDRLRLLALRRRGSLR